jgi:hypothetical protein
VGSGSPAVGCQQTNYPPIPDAPPANGATTFASGFETSPSNARPDITTLLSVNDEIDLSIANFPLGMNTIEHHGTSMDSFSLQHLRVGGCYSDAIMSVLRRSIRHEVRDSARTVAFTCTTYLESGVNVIGRPRFEHINSDTTLLVLVVLYSFHFVCITLDITDGETKIRTYDTFNIRAIDIGGTKSHTFCYVCTHKSGKGMATKPPIRSGLHHSLLGIAWLFFLPFAFFRADVVDIGNLVLLVRWLLPLFCWRS